MGALATAERATGCGDSDRDGRQAYDLAVQGLGWDPARVVVFGRSIGTGPAVRLAAQAPVSHVLLLSLQRHRALRPPRSPDTLPGLAQGT